MIYLGRKLYLKDSLNYRMPYFILNYIQLELIKCQRRVNCQQMKKTDPYNY